LAIAALTLLGIAQLVLAACSSEPLGEPLGTVASRLSCAVDADCATGNPCREAICDPNEQVCAYTTVDVVCDDGNSCTTGDVCVAGNCVGGPAASGCSACNAAATLPAEGGMFTGSVQGTSSLTGSCADQGGSPERIYAWTPTSTGLATFETCGGTTNYDTVLYLLNGTCSGSAQGACNDDTVDCPAADGLPNSTRHGSRVTQQVTAGTTYYVVVDGWGGRRGNYSLKVVPPSTCGDGVREGSEQCDGSDTSECASGECNASCTCVVPSTGQPDLVPALSQISLAFDQTVSAGDVAEGCAAVTSGNDLLRFSATVLNEGTADITLGDPGCPNCSNNPLVTCGNPAFMCSPSEGHGHAHYLNYATYELLDQNSATVATGHKQGFCLRDNLCATGVSPKFNCEFQGISAGCSDIYAADLGCQYIDISAVPPGTYTLRVRIDPFNRFAELNEDNNVASTTVVIPNRDPDPDPDPDPVPAPEVLPPEGGTFTGTTAGSSAAGGSCAAASANSPERVLAWTPSASGRATISTCGGAGAQGSFDTVLYVRNAASGGDLACNDDTVGCGVADGSPSGPRHGSSFNVNVEAGQTYHIFVDGYDGSSGASEGGFVLNVVPPAPAPPAPVVPTLPAIGGSFTGTTAGTSLYSGACEASATAQAPEAVYAWTPERSGTARITTCGAQGRFDTVLYVTSALGSGSLACNDDTAGCGVTDGTPNAGKHGSSVTLNVTAGTTYYLYVDGYFGSSGGSSGAYVLNVTPPP
jgi:hypothetical protein